MDVFEYVLWFVVSVEMAEMISLISARISAFFFAVSEETVASFEVLKYSLVAVPVSVSYTHLTLPTKLEV